MVHLQGWFGRCTGAGARSEIVSPELSQKGRIAISLSTFVEIAKLGQDSRENSKNHANIWEVLGSYWQIRALSDQVANRLRAEKLNYLYLLYEHGVRLVIKSIVCVWHNSTSSYLHGI